MENQAHSGITITSKHVSILEEPRDHTLATGTITLNGVVQINGFKIIYLNSMYGVKWALNATVDSEYRHVAHPVDKAFKTLVETTLIEEYQRIADSEKWKELLADLRYLRAQESHAREGGREELADLLKKAGDAMEGVIDQQ
jgi:DNA-binding cell septation regulator SpoVG